MNKINILPQNVFVCTNIKCNKGRLIDEINDLKYH